MTKWKVFVCATFLIAPASAIAESVTFDVHQVSEKGVESMLGTIDFKDTDKGLEISPHLHDLLPGDHGFHVHQNPDCGPKEKEGKMSAAEAAGSHLDPEKKGAHLGPDGHGHLGDLPVLTVASDGKADKVTYAPRLKVADIKNRSVIIHAGGDTYSDTPKPLGGGGARVGCGVIQG
jgi:Cu-Zn family superoxide dismutase